MDLSKCGPADLPAGAEQTNCCPPVSSTIIDFVPPTRSGRPLRVRPAAHLAGEEYVKKYAKAVELVKALPADDPRSFRQQANIHCSYCDSAYDQVGIELDRGLHVKFDVYINSPEAAEPMGPASEFAGSFVNVPHNHRHSKKKTALKTNLRLGISDLIGDIGAENDDSLVVSLVPRTTNGDKVKIGGIRIEFSS
ncbi:Polyphenol oxidase, chloroplastic [Apostasia shenzhenica]|uniref:Polyphenol oxidase, chloroplastic n=1 Tax=Apostasia shenzhenica TaxID=1088818 RepID=A0A2I0B7G0_9ASPA|nr:Polyphenol oxidase, chloroplastic [Apostasia shenzhenica]